MAASAVAGHPPWAVFDASTGHLLLRSELLPLLSSTPVEAAAVALQAGLSSVKTLLDQLQRQVMRSMHGFLVSYQQAYLPRAPPSRAAATPSLSRSGHSSHWCGHSHV